MYRVTSSGSNRRFIHRFKKLIAGSAAILLFTAGFAFVLAPAQAALYNPSGCLTYSQLGAVLAQFGVSGTNRVVYHAYPSDVYGSSQAIMTAISTRESGRCTDPRHNNSARGLWQILPMHGLSEWCKVDAVCSTQWAVANSNTGTYFQPWDRNCCGWQAHMRQDQVDFAASQLGQPIAASPRATPVGPAAAPIPKSKSLGIVPSVDGKGYWLFQPDGGVFSFGNAPFYGSAFGKVNASTNPVTAMAKTITGRGYWLTTRNGSVYSFGDAAYKGGASAIAGRSNITSMAMHKNSGYWLLGADGGIFSFGSAPFKGSAVGYFNASLPAVAMTPTNTGNGYWISRSDGAVYSFGDARYKGGANTIAGHAPIVAIAPHGTDGYYQLGADGGVFTFGSAIFKGSWANRPFTGKPVGLAHTYDSGGYWMTTSTGGVYTLGNAVNYGHN